MVSPVVAAVADVSAGVVAAGVVAAGVVAAGVVAAGVVATGVVAAEVVAAGVVSAGVVSAGSSPQPTIASTAKSIATTRKSDKNLFIKTKSPFRNKEFFLTAQDIV